MSKRRSFGLYQWALWQAARPKRTFEMMRKLSGVTAAARGILVSPSWTQVVEEEEGLRFEMRAEEKWHNLLLFFLHACTLNATFTWCHISYIRYQIKLLPSAFWDIVWVVRVPGLWKIWFILWEVVGECRTAGVREREGLAGRKRWRICCSSQVWWKESFIKQTELVER